MTDTKRIEALERKVALLEADYSKRTTRQERIQYNEPPVVQLVANPDMAALARILFPALETESGRVGHRMSSNGSLGFNR